MKRGEIGPLDLLGTLVRQKDDGDGAPVGEVFAAANSEVAAVSLDDAMGDPEAKPGAIQRLRRVKGLEDPMEDLSGHAVTGVGDRKANSALPLRVVL